MAKGGKSNDLHGKGYNKGKGPEKVRGSHGRDMQFLTYGCLAVILGAVLTLGLVYAAWLYAVTEWAP